MYAMENTGIPGQKSIVIGGELLIIGDRKVKLIRIFDTISQYSYGQLLENPISVVQKQNQRFYITDRLPGPPVP